MKNFTCIALGVLFFTAGCATSSQQITSTRRPQIPPNSVKIYYTIPAHSEVVGPISAVSFSGVTLEQADEDVLAMLKIEAGGLGANGVVIGSLDDQPLHGAKASGNAVYVTPWMKD